MDKAIEQILAEDATAPNQREYRLAVIADTDTSIDGYVAAWNMSNDSFMKNYHFQKALEVTKANPTIMNYSKAYLFCTDIGKDAVAAQLLIQMAEQYPIFSHVHKLPLKIAALIRRD